MSGGRHHDVSNTETVYRTVTRPGGEALVCEHTITEVAPTEVRVSRAAVNDDVPAFYKSRSGTYVLDREELENEGCARYDSTQTYFYLNREDAIGASVRKGSVGDGDVGASESDRRPLPTIYLRAEVAKRLERVASGLDSRYGEALTTRFLLETALRQVFVDVQVHGKDSPLVQQLDTLSLHGGLQASRSGEDLHPLPVDSLHAEVMGHFKEILSALESRYGEGFSERHFIEVALQQMFTDLRTYQHESTIIQWLDAFLLEGMETNPQN